MKDFFPVWFHFIYDTVCPCFEINFAIPVLIHSLNGKEPIQRSFRFVKGKLMSDGRTSLSVLNAKKGVPCVFRIGDPWQFRGLITDTRGGIATISVLSKKLGIEVLVYPNDYYPEEKRYHIEIVEKA